MVGHLARWRHNRACTSDERSLKAKGVGLHRCSLSHQLEAVSVCDDSIDVRTVDWFSAFVKAQRLGNSPVRHKHKLIH